MPGFGNNTQIINGGAVSAGASGSVRFPLTPFATRDPFTGESHTADTINFKNNGTPLPVSGGATGNEAACIHVTSLTALDEVYLWASNKGETDAQLTLSFVSGGYQINGQTAPSDQLMEALTGQQRIVTTIRAKSGLQLVYPGIPHTNNDAIFAMSSNRNMNICGFVMRRFRQSPTDPNQGFDGQE